MSRLRSFALFDQIRSVPTFERISKKVRPLAPTVYEQEYLLGVRGLLVIECFLWTFLQTFVPVAVAGSNNAHGPLYQRILRYTLSVIFWNENLLYSSFIFLSARSIAIPFIREPNRARVAGSVFRRGLSLWFPVAVALAIVKLTFSQTGETYIYNFKIKTRNTSFQVPYSLPTGLAYFNSVFNIFWTTHNYSVQAGSTAFPSQTLWIINAIYQQSYTIYVTMIIIPYTRDKWRVQGSLFFVITGWWAQSWSWLSVTGLIIADMVMNMDFKARAKRGIPIWRTSKRCPTWIPCAMLIIAGFAMQYIWTDWRPDLLNAEYLAHTGLYYTPGLNTNDSGRYPQARDDTYLILLGFFMLLESSDTLQSIFKNRALVFLGRRSLSFFLTQSTLIFVVGIKLYTHLRYIQHVSFPGTVIVTLITCLAVIVPAAETFHRLVEKPSKILAHKSYEWITDQV